MQKKHFYTVIFLFLLRGLVMAQTTFTESNLPIITINTNGQNIPDDYKITADIRIISNANMYNRPTDSANVYFGKIGIETRGSTSQFLSPKKPFSIELRDAAGNGKDVGLFGLTKEADWALIAPYADKSLIRDALTYQLAASIMPYAPHTRFCELVQNGQYQGVYVLTETVKRKRLGISKADSTMLTGDALTGGYIIKIDKNTGNPAGISDGFMSQYAEIRGQKTAYLYHYPKPEDIKPPQVNYIKTFIRDFENTMKSDNFSNDTVGYAKYFDVNSLIDFFLINELTRNVDGYRLSTYMYKDKNSLTPTLKMGPVWDFNIALGNANYCGGEKTSGWAYNFSNICPDDGYQVPFWWTKLISDKKFNRKVKARWQALRQTAFKTDRIMGIIDSMTNLLNAPQARNFRTWNTLNQWIWPNATVTGSYNGEISYLKTWLTERIRWIDGAIETLQVSEHPKNPLYTDIFPNPSYTLQDVQFAYYLNADISMTLRIFNTCGQLVNEQKITQQQGDNTLFWRGNGEKGLFIYQLWKDNDLWERGKLVKY